MTCARPGGALLAAGLATGAASAGFHETFAARCFSCHRHAGAFAHQSLTEVDGTLTGRRSGLPVASFLAGDAGGLPPAEIDRFIRVFTAELRSGRFFHERCATSHGRAHEFARRRLPAQDGRLVGHYSGRDIAAFLPGHADLTGDEAGRMLGALTALGAGSRQARLSEGGRPGACAAWRRGSGSERRTRPPRPE